jgi:hypothetical protein
LTTISIRFLRLPSDSAAPSDEARARGALGASIVGGLTPGS